MISIVTTIDPCVHLPVQYLFVENVCLCHAWAGDNRAEDPWLFQNIHGYHIVFHQYNQSDTVTGGHLYSPDGYTWTSSTEAVYDVSMDFSNGTTKRVDHRERPTLLTSKEGRPEWLITGVEVGSKDASFPDCFSETALTQIL